MTRNTFILLMIVFISFTSNTKATHIIGGELIYECLDPATNFYRFTMKLYRDCYTGVPPFDSVIYLSVYDSMENLLIQFDIALPPFSTLDNNTYNLCLFPPPNVCVEEALYTADYFLPPGKYYITYQRCCRNQDIVNIFNPQSQGAGWDITIPETSMAICNSSPYYNQYPPTIICLDSQFVYDHSATDPDGDSLVYYLCTPNDYSSDTLGIIPNPCGPPSSNFDLTYVSPYGSAYPIWAPVDSFKIDPQSGLLTGTPTQSGRYVVGVCVSEYRNGVLLSTNNREFQFNVAQCDTTACDTPITGLPNEVRELNVHIYPNPNTGQFTLNVSGEAGGGIQIKIFNLFGQLILNKDLSGFENLTGLSQQIDLSNYAKGIYYMQVVTGENVFTRKIVYQ